MSISRFEGARLHRLLKNSISARFVSGHDFSRADKLFVFVIPSGLQPARDLLFGLFQEPVQPCRTLLSLAWLYRLLKNPLSTAFEGAYLQGLP